MILNDNRELTGMYKVWMEIGKKFLKNIIAYSEYLISNNPDLTEDQRKKIQNIHHNGMHILNCWHSNLLEYYKAFQEEKEEAGKKSKTLRFAELFFQEYENAETSLANIIEIVDLLLEEKFGIKQENLFKKIRYDAINEIECWSYPSNYLKFRIGQEKVITEPVNIAQIADEAMEYLKKNTSLRIDKERIHIDSKIPLVKGNKWLNKAIIGLIRPIFSLDKILEDFVPIIEAERLSDEEILVKVQSGLEVEKFSKIFNTDTVLMFSKLIIESYGSQIEAYGLDIGTEFRFTLTATKEGK